MTSLLVATGLAAAISVAAASYAEWQRRQSDPVKLLKEGRELQRGVSAQFEQLTATLKAQIHELRADTAGQRAELEGLRGEVRAGLKEMQLDAEALAEHLDTIESKRRRLRSEKHREVAQQPAKDPYQQACEQAQAMGLTTR